MTPATSATVMLDTLGMVPHPLVKTMMNAPTRLLPLLAMPDKAGAVRMNQAPTVAVVAPDGNSTILLPFATTSTSVTMAHITVKTLTHATTLTAVSNADVPMDTSKTAMHATTLTSASMMPVKTVASVPTETSASTPPVATAANVPPPDTNGTELPAPMLTNAPPVSALHLPSAKTRTVHTVVPAKKATPTRTATAMSANSTTIPRHTRGFPITIKIQCSISVLIQENIQI